MQTFGSTEKGLVRKTNQDSYVIATNEVGDLFVVVCDGIGGGKSGDVASELAVKFFSEAFSINKGFNSEEEVLDWLRYHVRKANDQIFSLSTTRKDYNGMGTTFVALLSCNIGKYVINIGDSRAYAVFTDGRFKQITEDHTMVQELINTKQISEEEALKHSNRNYITNALGVWDKVKADVYPIKDKVDLFLICSDGLHGYVDKSIIEKVLLDKNLTTQNKQQKLMSLALAVGGYDNITIVIVKTGEEDEHE